MSESGTEPDRTLREAEAVTDLVRGLCPSGIIELGGNIVGCWFTLCRRDQVGRDAGAAPTAARVDVTGLLRTSDGRVVGIECVRDPAPGLPTWISRELSRASLLSGDAVSDRASARAFVAGMRKASTLASRGIDGRTGRAPSLSALGWTVERALGRRPRPEIMSAASHVWFAETRERIERFLATLDPHALSLFRERTDLDDLMGRAWPGLDRTFDPNAPLAAALQARPHQARLLLRLWSEEPRSVRSAVSAGKVDRLVGGRLVANGHLPSHLLPKLVEAERALDVAAARSPHIRPGPSGDALGHARRLIGLSPAWQPTSTADWLAFMALSPLTDHVRSWSGPKGMLPRLLGHDGSWERLADSIVQVTRTTDMRLAVARVDAMATAYAQRVLMPAFALANGHDPDVGPRIWTAWRNAAHTILTSGRSLRGILHAATSWDGSRWRADGLRASAPADMEWPACLPDRQYQGSRLHVVSGEATLRALLSDSLPVASPLDADEIVRQCAMGRMRAVTTLVDDGAGWRPRSMALLRISDRPVVVQAHFGLHDGAPPAECVEALSRYLRDMGRGCFSVDAEEFRAAVRRPTVSMLCGHDGRDIEAWERARLAWDPFVPAGLRGLAPRRIADAARSYLVDGSRRWREEPVGSIPTHPSKAARDMDPETAEPCAPSP